MGSQISFFADDIAPGISVLFDANYCIILNFCFHVYFSFYVIHVTSVYVQKYYLLIMSTDYGPQNTEASLINESIEFLTPLKSSFVSHLLLSTGVHYKECATHTIVVQTYLSRCDITTTLVHGPEYH